MGPESSPSGGRARDAKWLGVHETIGSIVGTQVSVGPNTTALIEILERAAALLRSHDEDEWAAWLESDRALLERGDFDGVTHFLSAFAEWNKLNDVTLLASNGHVLAVVDADRVTAMLRALLSKGHDLAKAISREGALE